MDFSNRFGSVSEREEFHLEVKFDGETHEVLYGHITDAINKEDSQERIAALETLVAQYGSVLESASDIESEVSEEFLGLVVSLNRLLALEQAQLKLDTLLKREMITQ